MFAIAGDGAVSQVTVTSAAGEPLVVSLPAHGLPPVRGFAGEEMAQEASVTFEIIAAPTPR